MINYVLIYVFSVFVSALSQVMLKISAKKEYDTWIKEYLNPLVIVAYGIFFCSSLLTIVAYKKVPLSMGPVIESCGYVFVTLLGYFWLHEKISKQKILGVFLILLGIFVFYI